VPLRRTRILIVDHDAAITTTLSINLHARGYPVDSARTGAAALKQASDRPPALTILNLELPDHDGMQVIATLAGSSPAPIIVTSARDGPPDRTDAISAGAAAFLVKPFGMDKLLQTVARLIGPHP
jgi:two-component system KDP operon response regulator KdpE